MTLGSISIHHAVTYADTYMLDAPASPYVLNIAAGETSTSFFAKDRSRAIDGMVRLLAAILGPERAEDLRAEVAARVPHPPFLDIEIDQPEPEDPRIAARAQFAALRAEFSARFRDSEAERRWCDMRLGFWLPHISDLDSLEVIRRETETTRKALTIHDRERSETTSPWTGRFGG